MASKPLQLVTRTRRPLSAFISRPISRQFHSADHPAQPSPFTPTESLILSRASKHIPSHGFTSTSLSLGAKDAGYIDASTNLFHDGAGSLVRYYLWDKRMGLKDRVGELNAKGVWEVDGMGKKRGVGSRVKLLSWERLMGNKEVVHKWQEALALLATPPLIPTALSELASLSDEIWYLSGDVSVDSSWYTKRASLSTVYAASELYMTTDKSEGFRDTKEFLERRFGDAQVLGQAVGNAGQWVGFTASAAVNVLRSKGVRI